MSKSIDIGTTYGHTNSMKIAISIPDHLFEEVSKLAQKKQTSRSQIFRRAVEEYLAKLRSLQMLEALNSAYANDEIPSERLLRKKCQEHYAETILREGPDDDQAG